MRANYHTHTYRCGHAVGTERDYVRQAVDDGLEILGFSDHTPYEFDRPGAIPNVRMAPEELDGYVSSLLALREEYAGQIALYVGLEAEYYPALFPRLLERLRARPVDYLILGQHFLGNEIGEPYSGRATEDKAVLDRYVSQSIEGMQTGCFTYFAHPDLIRFTGDGAEYARQMRRLCRAAKDCALPLECNLLGLREGRNYPDERFWRIAAEEGNAVILGCDAHQPEHVRAPETEARARQMLARYGITPMETVELKRP